MKRAVLIAALTAAFIAASAPAQAYEQDTHYGLTYYLARQAGYIPQNAHRVANAAWSIDVNETTEPARTALWGTRFIPLIGAISVVVKTKAFRPEQVKVLRSFHGFPDNLPASCSSTDNVANIAPLKNDPQVAARLTMLRQQGRTELKNPGVLLHYFEDVYGHAGFACDNGVGHARALHLPDFLSWKQNVSRAMARDTVTELKDFLTATGMGVPCDGDTEQVDRMVVRMVQANPPNIDSLNTLPWWFIALMGDGMTGVGPTFEHTRTVIDSGLPSGEHLPDFEYKDLVLVDAPDGYFNARNTTSSAGLQLLDQNGAIFLVNEAWRSDGDKPQRVRFRVDAGHSDLNAVSFSTRVNANSNADTPSTGHEWEFVAYLPSTKEWQFQRKPAASELPDTAPPEFGSHDPADWTWAKDQVADQLRLHLTIKVEPGTCRLKGTYYRGLWRFQKGSGGERRAWVPEGLDGWGKGEDVRYLRDFQQVR